MARDPVKTSAAAVAVVLAGGLSRRLGGGDKPLLTLRGRTLLDHVLDRLRPQVRKVALNANGDASRFACFGLAVLPDPLRGHPGPLAGVLAAMLWARRCWPEASSVLTVPGDTPFLPVDLAATLAEAAGDGIAYAASFGRAHPTAALWPVALADTLTTAIADGQRRVRDWADSQGAVAVAFSGDPDPFFNVNTPEDLAWATAMVTDR